MINHDLIKVVNRKGLHKKQFNVFIGFDSLTLQNSYKNTV